QRERTYATDLGFGFAIPHGKAATVKAASIAFLRARRPFPWAAKNASPVQGVLLIAVPAEANGREHLQLIARLSRRLMHEDFRDRLLSARDGGQALDALRQCLLGS
ncbi:MAG TPA: PTS sugar transporter subunit IIA, partial [Acidobacteriota bacterium]